MPLLLFLLATLLLAAAGAIFLILHFLTHPPRRTYASALARSRPGDPSELRPPREFSSWSFRSRSRDLPVWDTPGDNPAGPIIILTHGWGDSRLGALSRIARLAPLASRLIAWDMPGHGEAPGTTSLGAREHQDLAELIRTITQGAAAASTSTRSGPPVILFGWSLGAGVSIETAARLRDALPASIAAVIAEAPYRMPITPARNVLRAAGLPHGVLLRAALAIIGLAHREGARWPRFDRAAWASKLHMPLLIIHGEHDDVSPVTDARDIVSACAHATLAIIPNAGHHGLWTNDATAAECLGRVRHLLGSLRGEPPTTPPSTPTSLTHAPA